MTSKEDNQEGRHDDIMMMKKEQQHQHQQQHQPLLLFNNTLTTPTTPEIYIQLPDHGSRHHLSIPPPQPASFSQQLLSCFNGCFNAISHPFNH